MVWRAELQRAHRCGNRRSRGGERQVTGRPPQEVTKMSELAFNRNGEGFDVPPTVMEWRVLRMRPRGAPELAYGRDGRPLTVPVDADIDELRDAVGTPGKYRLDP